MIPSPRSQVRSWAQAHSPTATVGLFQGSSGNALTNSAANAAHRDIWNVGNVHIYPSHALHAGQGLSSLPQQPLSIFSYILSTFTTLVARTAVTLGSPQYGAPYATMLPNPSATPSFDVAQLPDPTNGSSERRSAQAADEIPSEATEGAEIKSGDFEITLLEDLDMDMKHQPKAFYRSSDLPNGLSFDGIYIRKIYPNGHGYPCPNPSPEGPPVRIGDIGELTSTGFTTLANLADCQLPSLQGELAALALSDPWHEPNYFSEGQSITGGVNVQKISHLLGSKTIQDIKYRCHAPQGAVLAVASRAQLHTLTRDRNSRLRAWLCKHGLDLLRLLDPGRTDPLYIVTGKVTSSSWATATYSEPLPEPDNSLVLTHFPDDLPPYHWTEPGNSRNWSKSSSSVNSQGERESDQCLFLRGFLLTPSPKYTSRQTPHALNIGDTMAGPDISKSHPNLDTAGGSLGEGGSHTQSFRPSSRSGASREATMSGGAKDLESLLDNPLVEEVPSSSSATFYPSQRINERLLELTDAELAITHDDDWRFRLEALHNYSMLDRREDTPASVSSNSGLAVGDRHTAKHVHRSNQISSMNKMEDGQAGLNKSFDNVKGANSANPTSRDITAPYHGKKADAIKKPQWPPMLKGFGTGETMEWAKLRMPPKSIAHTSTQTQTKTKHLIASLSPQTIDILDPLFLPQVVPDSKGLPAFKMATPQKALDLTEHSKKPLVALSKLKSVPDHRAIHIQIWGKAAPKTGQWFLQWEKYWLWVESKHRDYKILWGVGSLGAGKTVLASIVIEDLEYRDQCSDDRICVCYVYFRYGDTSPASVREVLEILVKQTLEQYPREADQLYVRHLREKAQPTEGELLRLLEGFVGMVAATFYVLEALDEAPVNIQLDLVGKFSSLNVKLLITSRPMETVQAHFPDAQYFLIAAQDSDLDLHISNRIVCSPDLCHLFSQADTAWKEQMVSSIKQKCGGMFLYASLQLDALQECTSIHDVNEVLEAPPPKVTDTYLQAWQRILDQPTKKALLAKTILLWVLNASRSMAVEELQHAVATSPETHKFEPTRLVPKPTIIDLCRGLLVVEKGSRNVRLVHDSARDTLQALILESFSHPQAHLVKVCIEHLTGCGFQRTKLGSTDDLVSTLQGDPLLTYAYHGWASSGQESIEDTSISSRFAEFVAGCHAFPVAIGEDRQFEVLGPLHVTSFFDLPIALAGPGATQNPNIPTRNRGLTPLSLACHEGSTRAAEELLGLPGILVNESDNDGWAPLHWASWYGCEGLVEKLLADPELQVNLANNTGQTPLMLASLNGHTGIIDLLLALTQTNVNIADGSGKTALMLASQNCHIRTVERFLAHPQTDINMTDGFGQTALMSASYGRKDIVKLLLAKPGIEANLKGVNGRSALFIASLQGHEEIVKLFLAFPGIEVGYDMFLAASAGGHSNTERLLSNFLLRLPTEGTASGTA